MSRIPAHVNQDPARHVDFERIAAIGLGEDRAEVAEVAHIASCRSCRDEAAGLERMLESVRLAEGVRPLEHPDRTVWNGIEASLGLRPGRIVPVDHARLDERSAHPV